MKFAKWIWAGTAFLVLSVPAYAAGTVKGKVIFEGPAPAMKNISVRGNPECALLHAGGEVANEEIIAQGGTLKNVFVYVKEGLAGKTFESPFHRIDAKILHVEFNVRPCGIDFELLCTPGES